MATCPVKIVESDPPETTIKKKTTGDYVIGLEDVASGVGPSFGGMGWESP